MRRSSSTGGGGGGEQPGGAISSSSTSWVRPDSPLHAHFDCFSGAAGDMILASCLDAVGGGDLAKSNALLRHVDLCIRKGMPSLNGEFVITKKRVWRGVGRIVGTHITVQSLYQHQPAPVPMTPAKTPGTTTTPKLREKRKPELDDAQHNASSSSLLSHHHPYTPNSRASRKNSIDHNNNNNNSNGGNRKVATNTQDTTTGRGTVATSEGGTAGRLLASLETLLFSDAKDSELKDQLPPQTLSSNNQPQTHDHHSHCHSEQSPSTPTTKNVATVLDETSTGKGEHHLQSFTTENLSSAADDKKENHNTTNKNQQDKQQQIAANPHSHGPHDHSPSHQHDHSHSHAHEHSHAHHHDHHNHSHEHHTSSHAIAEGVTIRGPLRNLPEIRRMLEEAPEQWIPVWVRTMAIRAFTALAEAEASVHGADSRNAVHFHEVGAVDSIVDTVGSLLALHALGVESVSCSPLPLGEGTVRTAHGLLPVPAPATLCLMIDMPTTPGPPGLSGELVTPTGAALLRALVMTPPPSSSNSSSKSPNPAVAGATTTTALRRTARPPRFTLRQVGIGAGTKDFENHPNILRLMLGSR